jgi:putative FmdB family regulatory protein
MPIYEYQCVACDDQFDRMLPIACYKDPQDCPECGGATKRLVSAVNFNLTGDGWASKNGRIKKQMAEKNRRLDAKQAEMKRDAPGMTLAPNVEGERVDTWSEAASLAKSKGKDSSGYEKRASKEKAGG